VTAPSAAMNPVRHTVLDRIVGAFLLLLMAVGSLGLWIGVPAGVLYGLSQVTSSSAQHLAFSVLAVPVAMLLFALILFRLNALYLRVTVPDWAEEEDEDDEPRVMRGPLELLLLGSLALAIFALAFAINWAIAVALALVLIAFPRFPRRGW
jgi:ABC-type dipeptide/oligopeptide/nickel transport system permease component